MSKIFLSYVRDDSEADTGRLADTLTRELPGANLFIDVRDIEYGGNWKRIIERAIEDSVIMLCAMGPEWKPSPPVALELTLALRSNVPVVPLLFRKANIINLTDGLQSDIAELKDRNAISIEHSTWHQDITPLIGLLKKVLSDPSHSRVIIDPPDPKHLLEISPSPVNKVQLLNYAQDLAECLADEDVFAEAKEAAARFEEEWKQKWEYDSEMRMTGYYYQNIRAPEPKLIQIVEAARTRLEIEQSIHELLDRMRFDESLYEKVALYLGDETLLAKLSELHQEFADAVKDYKEGGVSNPNEPAKEFREALAAAKEKLKAELPGITKRYPDRKWPSNPDK